MINKKSKKNSTRTAIIIILVTVLLGVLGFVFWNNFMQSKPDISSESTLVVKGKITEKRTSCGREILDSNGKPERVAGICDAGNSIVVDNVTISTGGGSNGTDRPKYITNIDSLHAGDVVEVRYILDKDERPSTDCESCFVKKEGSLQKEPQNKQGQ